MVCQGQKFKSGFYEKSFLVLPATLEVISLSVCLKKTEKSKNTVSTELLVYLLVEFSLA